MHSHKVQIRPVYTSDHLMYITRKYKAGINLSLKPAKIKIEIYYLLNNKRAEPH
ncbi:hypothetical protein [Pontibacter vulgaris]|uniref:hypothetical protein n=1 Tax=Pontibacter vulgaris TaxID=2905679 RepID=UPI001FA6AE28|nr:hypothetical protein [Pontibacter vulgaris]